MGTSEPSPGRRDAIVIVSIAGVLLVSSFIFAHYGGSWPRGEALGAALHPLIDQKGTPKSLLATSIWDNYSETRANAERWSAIYWGITFFAAALSALAGVILKFETMLKSEPVKKDLAALFSVTAAVLITISTGGDFHRKWQANRIASAELERVGYQLLSKGMVEPTISFTEVARILYERNILIAGEMESKARPVGASESMPAGQK